MEALWLRKSSTSVWPNRSMNQVLKPRFQCLGALPGRQSLPAPNNLQESAEMSFSVKTDSKAARRLVVAVARLAPPAEPGQPKAETAAVRAVVESSAHRTSLWPRSA